ncbi:pyridoxal-dependent decarboxylase [Bacteriovorax sp. DB6_IX]|uniref:pyridoxal-dependent decarboxylase n=1 Tax=Bacteriovorax sp. DB6_IX TaxID=1353530 RepID=UPI00038A10CF|nr:pyridoxal-dependent decarboxylase [Bacteriovorax sp. DB6_IX]EQC50726.1 pyridoxal-dependent decarboxylase domain protein [Bacteriovorax sp. DB6_IX]
MFWPALTEEAVSKRVFSCLEKNINFRDNILLGIPGTHLDERVFPLEDLVRDKPFLSSFVANPNHIGMHTDGDSEVFFNGTHQLEVEAIQLCAQEIMRAKAGEYNGYIASGGTEANIQGIWQLRNYFQHKYKCSLAEIAIIHSVDTHYSVYKAGNLLSLKTLPIDVHFETREMDISCFELALKKAKEQGVKYFIFFANMGTTMFGSVDEISTFTPFLEKYGDDYWIHIDGAFGGFIYPFTHLESKMNFSHPKVSSITMDAHKMLQAPYGTGIFLSRKIFSDFTFTDKASYVKGNDSTLCGSRSGANAISVWMILNSYGSQGGIEFCQELIERTDFLCYCLDKIKVKYFRNPYMNIVTIPADQISEDMARKYHLVFDRVEKPQWFKVVVMDHVKVEHIDAFIDAIC